MDTVSCLGSHGKILKFYLGVRRKDNGGLRNMHTSFIIMLFSLFLTPCIVDLKRDAFRRQRAYQGRFPCFRYSLAHCLRDVAPTKPVITHRKPSRART